MTSITLSPLWAMAVFRMACNCFLSPLKDRATKVAPHLRARAQQSKGGNSLSLGQAVNAIIFNDIDERHIAAHEVHKLAEADGGGIAVAGNADPHQRTVGQQRSGGDGRHASVDAVEAGGIPREEGR